jgi:hypothetical protein
MPAGRPTKYKPEYVKQAKKLALLGATDKQVAGFFDVNELTINRWKEKYPEFCKSLKDGKKELDSQVQKSLYFRATGYSHPEDKIFNNNGEPLIVPTTKHYPPDPTSIIFWLKNRQPEKWRDKQDHNHTGDLVIRIIKHADDNPTK